MYCVNSSPEGKPTTQENLPGNSLRSINSSATQRAKVMSEVPYF